MEHYLVRSLASGIFTGYTYRETALMGLSWNWRATASHQEVEVSSLMCLKHMAEIQFGVSRISQNQLQIR